jgi:hypothetical protein
MSQLSDTSNPDGRGFETSTPLGRNKGEIPRLQPIAEAVTGLNFRIGFELVSRKSAI